MLKTEFGISTKNSLFDSLFTNSDFFQQISDIANNKSKGKTIDRKKFIEFYRGRILEEITSPETEKLKFFIEDYKLRESAIRVFLDQIFNLDDDEKAILKIEQNEDAIKILNKFHYLQECVVCDHEIDSNATLKKKEGSTRNVGYFIE